MFNRFSVKLAKKSAFDLPQICVLLEDAYVPKPSIKIVEETYDCRSFLIGAAINMPSFAHLNDHSFQHQFRIKQVEEQTLMWCKKYSNSEDWLPMEGLKFLLFVRDCEIQQAKYMLLFTTSETQKAERKNCPIDPLQCLNEIKETIHGAHVYFPASSLEWWESFFTKQVKPVEELKDDMFQLEHAFVWHHGGLCKKSGNVVASGVNTVQILANLLSLIHGETRKMYVGPRKSTKCRQ
ncbi:hypothetical protein GOP47_0029745 [Adiantum capillus-veneris]|nr:hypothetical protein GOP47_0029745 [Adiantum capillus-veneris]